MQASRLDQVRVDVAGNVVEISWAERDWLLEKIATVAGFASIIEKFEAVGASMPAELNFDERARLRAPLEFWEHDLTTGLTRLLIALVCAAPGGHVGTRSYHG